MGARGVGRAPGRMDGAVPGRHGTSGGGEGAARAQTAGAVGEGAVAGRGEPRARRLHGFAARFGEFSGGAPCSATRDRRAAVVTGGWPLDLTTDFPNVSQTVG